MNRVLILLFAILDCKVWGVDTARAWADNLIQNSKRYPYWVIELSLARDENECLQIISRAMKDSWVVLPDDIGDIMVGLILLRMDGGEITAADGARNISDVVDAYGAGNMDVEAAALMTNESSVFCEFREKARQALDFVRFYKVR